MPDTPDVDAKDWAIINGACADADLLRIQERGLNPRSNRAHRYRNAAHRQQAALIAANARADEAEAGIANAQSALDIQGSNGNWNYDAYMHGMFNGMEFVLATIQGREPQFRDAPDEWLADRAAREAVKR